MSFPIRNSQTNAMNIADEQPRPTTTPIDILATLRRTLPDAVKTESRDSSQLSTTPLHSSSRPIARLPKRAMQPPASSSRQMPANHPKVHDPKLPRKKVKSASLVPIQ